MAIKFKVIEKCQPGVPGGGVKKYYASPVMNGELNLENMTMAIEKISTVSGADIRAVLYAIVEVTIGSLANGTIVRLGDIGSLRMSLSSRGEDKEENVKASSIRGGVVIFTPGYRIKEMINELKFRKG